MRSLSVLRRTAALALLAPALARGRLDAVRRRRRRDLPGAGRHRRGRHRPEHDRARHERPRRDRHLRPGRVGRRRRRRDLRPNPGGTVYDTNVGAGRGDDRVHSTEDSHIEVYLGNGDDEFTGVARRGRQRSLRSPSVARTDAARLDRRGRRPGPGGRGRRRDHERHRDQGRHLQRRHRPGAGPWRPTSLAASFDNDIAIDRRRSAGRTCRAVTAPASRTSSTMRRTTMTYESENPALDRHATRACDVYGGRGGSTTAAAPADDQANLYGLASAGWAAGTTSSTVRGLSGATGTLAGGTGGRRPR